MKDIEICKRIAEIEGFDSEEFTVTAESLIVGFLDGGYGSCLYNPLTDDALCFKLMVKYKIEFRMPSRIAECRVLTNTDAIRIYDENPNKAICLAIIEANS